MCVSLNFRACLMKPSANNIPSHTLQHLSLKCLAGCCPKEANSMMWTPERGWICSAAFSRQQNVDESLSTDDEGVPCSRVLINHPVCRASRRSMSSRPVRVVVVRSLELWWRRCGLVVRPLVLPSRFFGEPPCQQWQ